MNILKSVLIFAVSLLGMTACAGKPEGIDPVKGFEVDRYVGTWYEIARLDHWFERDLDKVTATYKKNEDGSIKVINRGFNTQKGEWSEAEGKAKFAGDTSEGFLKVSFFGPFYGPYVIFELDQKGYQYAFVTSGDDYLWLLSRTPAVSPEVKSRFITQAESLGFDLSELIFVKH